MRKRLQVFEQDSEILQMMASYRSHPVKELVTNAPWVIISVLLHVAFVVLAAYISWNVKVPQEAVILTPQIIKKLTPKTFVMKTIQPKKVEQDVNVEKQVRDNTQISQVNLPMLDDLMKKSKPNQKRSLLVRPGENPVFTGDLGGGMRLSGGTGNATRDMVDWREWTKGRILAVWLFDESLSMKDDQQEVKARVKEVYDKLELAAGIKGTSMKIVTTVASFGKKAHILIKEPTQDTEEVRKAIDRIQVDKSGVENYLGAINTVLNVFEPYAKKYRRRIVIILVTDEGGDDDDPTKLGADSPLEQTIARLKKANSAVLVFGKMGGFIRSGTGERLPNGTYVTVNRGRDTGRQEFMPFEGGLFDTWSFLYGGFGPYPYARLAHETGGMLFLLNTMTDAYDYEKLLDGYQPEVVSRREMLVRDGKNSLRRAIRECIIEWKDLRKKRPMPRHVRKHAIDRQTGRGLVGGKAVVDFCNRWIPRLESMANTSAPDSPKRWEANRQCMVAQLYKRRYIAKGYLVAMRNLKERRNVPLAGELGWLVSPSRTTPQKGSARERELAKVKAKYQYVIDRQAGTPWGAYARREVRYLGSVRVSSYGRSVRSPKTPKG